MKCDFCRDDFKEKDIHDSHDVPCYLFEGNRQARKNQADKFGRHWLCNNKENGCHKKYEKAINDFLKKQAKIFSIKYFKRKEENDSKTIPES